MKLNESFDGLPFSEPLISGIQACDHVLPRANSEDKCDIKLPCSKFARSQKSFLREKDICLFERWKKRISYRFASEGNHAQESHTCQCNCFVVFFYLQDHDLLRSETLIQLQRGVMTSLHSQRPKRTECKNKQRIHNH